MEKAEERKLTKGCAATGSCVPPYLCADDHLFLSARVADVFDC